MELLLLLVIGGLGVFLWKTYNKLRLLSEKVKRARADVIATMKKRLDIAQRLNDIAASYGEHEKLSHFTVGEMNSDVRKAETAEQSIGHVVSEIKTLATHYPDLKANQAYQQLMAQLEGLESTILDRRERYNLEVQNYNSARCELPQVLFASTIGFPEAPYFSVDENGLDTIAEFHTDDGRLLRDGIGRIAARVGQQRPVSPRTDDSPALIPTSKPE